MTMRIAAAALAALLMSPLPVLAQSPAPAAATPSTGGGPLDACRADVDKLCASAEKTPGWRGKCLRENTAKLSDGCKTAMTAMHEQRQKVRTACTTDIDQLCKADTADGGRPIRCLKTNEAKLSPGCKSAMAAFGEGDGPAKQ